MSENKSLLDRAISNFNGATTLYNQLGAEPAYLPMICFWMEQALEVALKYQLEYNYVEYQKTHDIETLIEIARKNSINLHLTDYIYDHAEMFSAWGTKTRYELNYSIPRHKVEAAFDGLRFYLESLVACMAVEAGDHP